MKKILFLLLFVFLVPLFSFASFVISPKSDVEVVNKPMYDIGDISSKKAYLKFKQSKFIPFDKKAKDINFRNEPLWFAFTLKNNSNEKQILSIQYKFLKKIELFVYGENRFISSSKDGILTPQSQKEFQGINLGFILKKTPEPLTYVLKINSFYPFQPHILIASEAETLRTQMIQSIFFFVLIGAVLTLVIYSSFLYFSTKESSYILLATYIFLLGLWLSFSHGYFSYYITSDPIIIDFLDIFLPPVSFITLTFFSINFLNINQYDSDIFRKTIILCIGSLALFFLNGIFYESSLLNTILILFFIIFNIFLGLRGFKKGYAPSKFYLIAVGGYFLGLFITFLTNYGFITYSFCSLQAQIIGSIWEIIFLSLALGYKIKLLLNETNQALLKNELQEKMLFLQSHYASIGELAGNITHQWKEPLAEIGAIQTNLEASLLIEGSVSNEKLSSAITQNNDILKHLSETINTFYRFFKHRRVQKEEFDITQEILNIQKMTYYSLKVDKITLEYEYYTKITTFGNNSEFANAILNIILNAKDVLVERQISNPLIKIATYLNDENIVITIEDNAGGIKQKPLERIFESGVSSKQNSIGLGLYIAKTIIEQKMRGKIKLKNIENGAMFTIILPLAHTQKLSNTKQTYYNLEESTLQRISRLEREVAKQSEIEKTLNQWEEIFNQTHWGVALHKGVSEHFEMINPAFLQMYGYTIEELKKMTIAQLFANESLELLQEKQKEAFKTSFSSFEAIHLRKGGTKFPVNIDFTVIKNENNEILYHILNIRDITKQKETQQEVFLKTFALNHVHEAIYLVDKQSQIHDLNDGACRALGYTKEELLQLHITDIDPEWPKERWPEHWEELKEKKTITIETHHMRKDGTTFPVEVEANYFEYNGVSYNLGLVRDISERKEIEKKKENEKMRLFFERQLVGMAITSPDKGWLHVNNKLCEMLGYSSNELKNMTWSEVTHPDDLKGNITLFEKLIKGEIEHYYYEKRFIKKDGSITFANLSIGCVRKEDGSVDYLIALIEDISKRKLFEMALKEKNSHYNSILENATDVMYLVEVTEDGRFIHKDINKAYLEVSGLQKEDVLDKYVDEFENKEY